MQDPETDRRDHDSGSDPPLDSPATHQYPAKEHLFENGGQQHAHDDPAQVVPKGAPRRCRERLQQPGEQTGRRVGQRVCNDLPGSEREHHRDGQQARRGEPIVARGDASDQSPKVDTRLLAGPQEPGGEGAVTRERPKDFAGGEVAPEVPSQREADHPGHRAKREHDEDRAGDHRRDERPGTQPLERVCLLGALGRRGRNRGLVHVTSR